jgi:hypothetical protein
VERRKEFVFITTNLKSEDDADEEVREGSDGNGEFPVEVFRKSAPGTLLYLLRSLTISLRKVDSKRQNRLNIA